MNATVVFTERFRSDLQAQTRRLVTEDRRDWAVRLIDEIELASKLLRRAPQAGAVDPQPRGRSIRRLVLHKLPFVVWYRWEERPAKVIVLRLFHVRQRR